MSRRHIISTGWTCREPGHWTNDEGDHFASTRKVREGMLHCNGWMWRTTYNGAWLINADTLQAAKRAVALASDLDRCIEVIQAEIARLEASTGLDRVHHVRAQLANAKAALASDDAAIIRTHAVHL